MKTYEFISRKGEEIKDGKTIHKDYLNVKLAERDFWHIYNQLTKYLEYSNSPEREVYLSIPLFGTLEETEE